MSLEKNEAVIRGLYEAYNKHDVALLDNFLAPDYVHHAQKLQGLESVKQYEAMIYKAFPDLHDIIEDIIAEGYKVWVRVKVTGTHTGEYRGLAPNGKKHTVVGVVSYRIFNGKIVEAWVVEDTLDSLKQLGLIEYTEKGKKLFPEDVK